MYLYFSVINTIYAIKPYKPDTQLRAMGSIEFITRDFNAVGSYFERPFHVTGLKNAATPKRIVAMTKATCLNEYLVKEANSPVYLTRSESDFSFFLSDSAIRSRSLASSAR